MRMEVDKGFRFWLSALAESKRQDGVLHTTCGTPAYVAPEIISRKGYNGAKADIWSCGVILFVLLGGYLSFHDSNLMEMYRKIAKADYRCPHWFPMEVRGLLSKILDSNPNTRISITKIMENFWFRRGFNFKPMKTKTDIKEMVPLDTDAVFGSCENSSSAQPNPDLAKHTNLNAFDIISLSTGFDLPGLFVENDQKKGVQFTSMQPASAIISKLEDVARHVKLKVKKKQGGLLKLEGSKEGRKGALSIDAEIYEFASSFHLVEVKKSGGDNAGISKAIETRI